MTERESNSAQQGILYAVSTPLGNLGDITARALEVLASVDRIAAEDTRHTGVLLKHFSIQTPCISCHDHNESDRIEQLMGYLEKGESIALVSDAGTPLISDPGFKLVRALTTAGYRVVPVPGPCAITTALVASGLPSDRFYFYGFPPAKKSGRLKWLRSLIAGEGTYIFYESKHRILQSLSDMAEVFGLDMGACVGRELTKEFESFYRGTLAEIIETLTAMPSLLGEFVVLVQFVPKPAVEAVLLDTEVTMTAAELQALLQNPPPKKQLAARLAELTSLSKQEWYRALI
jgi:16S rRNA (cytidine1402-2'-O)-methyltransferase